MGRGRKKKSVHPGQPCGPCNLCHHPSIHYCHIATWDENLKRKIRAITAVSDEQCICRACEGDFKHNSGKDGYRFRWMPEPGNFSGSKRCIVSSCTETGTIIHTSITTRDKVADLLHEQVLSEPKSLFTPLCASHYRQYYSTQNPFKYVGVHHLHITTPCWYVFEFRGEGGAHSVR